MEGLRTSTKVIRFGSFELDQGSGELRKDGAKIRLQEQPLQVLQILLETPGRLISREELQRRIWPSDTFVDFDHDNAYREHESEKYNCFDDHFLDPAIRGS